MENILSTGEDIYIFTLPAISYIYEIAGRVNGMGLDGTGEVGDKASELQASKGV